MYLNRRKKKRRDKEGEREEGGGEATGSRGHVGGVAAKEGREGKLGTANRAGLSNPILGTQ